MKSEWIVVKGGGVAGLRETEDKKSEAKGVKGKKRKVSAGVKRGELQSLKMRQRINKRTKMERGELKEEVSLNQIYSGYVEQFRFDL